MRSGLGAAAWDVEAKFPSSAAPSGSAHEVAAAERKWEWFDAQDESWLINFECEVCHENDVQRYDSCDDVDET